MSKYFSPNPILVILCPKKAFKPFRFAPFWFNFNEDVGDVLQAAE
jgi:hypothetical protein